jgi:nitrogenase molybdenum-iron protein alpha/beta subunit
MTSNPLPWSSSRLEGCTLSGALSVTTEVTDGLTVIHVPAGCSQHNASLLHATLLGEDTPHLLRILSSDLDEAGVIFGGEGALAAALGEAITRRPSVIFVLSTCVVQTIGDDVEGVCGRGWGVPVIPVPGSGFLGGGFADGMRNALIALGERAGEPGGRGDRDGGITLIGEKNLEADVEENFAEVSRLLALLGERPALRFVRGTSWDALGSLPGGRLNILRDPDLRPVGERFAAMWGTPCLDSFPVGLSGSLRFLREAAGILGVDPAAALGEEQGRQEEALARFDDLRGERIRFSPAPLSGAGPFASELVSSLGLVPRDDGVPLSLPAPLPVGTAGLVRLLHRWRRVLHA